LTSVVEDSKLFRGHNTGRIKFFLILFCIQIRIRKIIKDPDPGSLNSFGSRITLNWGLQGFLIQGFLMTPEVLEDYRGSCWLHRSVDWLYRGATKESMGPYGLLREWSPFRFAFKVMEYLRRSAIFSAYANLSIFYPDCLSLFRIACLLRPAWSFLYYVSQALPIRHICCHTWPVFFLSPAIFLHAYLPVYPALCHAVSYYHLYMAIFYTQ
jgi:hypothetical protein